MGTEEKTSKTSKTTKTSKMNKIMMHVRVMYILGNRTAKTSKTNKFGLSIYMYIRCNGILVKFQ